MSQTKAQLIDTLVASLLPASDSAIDIGSNAVRFANIYGDTLYGNGANLTGINTDLVSDTSPQLGGDLDVNGKKIKFPDLTGSVNNILYFGTGDDLLIYHFADINVIQCENARTLRLQHFSGGNETLANFIPNGAVELYYDNSKKLETTSFGVQFAEDVQFPSPGDTNALTWDKSEFTLEWRDNVKASWGDGKDLQIYHDGSDSYVQDAGTGKLVLATNGTAINLYDTANSASLAKFLTGAAVELYNNGSKKFETTNIGVTVTGGVTADGVTLGDNQNIQFGASNDLKIFHNGSHSYIADLGTGDLRITGSAIHLQDAAQSENMLKTFENDRVELYYDNSKKFETTNSGATVTGTLTATSFSGETVVGDTSPQLGGDLASNGNDILIADSDFIKFGTGNDLTIKHNGTHSVIENFTNNLYIGGSTSGQIILQKQGGDVLSKFISGGAVELYHDNSKKFETTSDGTKTTGSHTINLYQGTAGLGQLNFGESGTPNIKAFDTGNHGSGSLLQIRSGDGETHIECNRNGNVELYYDNVKRFSTNSSGAQVHGNNGNIFTASCATNSTASILFSNTEANTSGDMMVLVKTAANQGSDPYIKFDAGGNDMIVGTLYAGGANNKLVLGHGLSPSGGVIGLHIDGNGQITPDSNNARDLGNSSLRFRNIYTNDLNLSNEGHSNDVDGTWGSYTIQEGAEDLFLVNKRNGKKYKFNLTEVS